MIKQRKKGYDMSIIIVAELLLASHTKEDFRKNMKKNKEVHSACLHGSPACDMALSWPSPCLRERETAGGKKKILVFSHPASEMIAKLYDSISSSEAKMLCRKRLC